MRRPSFLLSLFLLLIPVQLGYHFWPSWSQVQGVRVDYLSPTLFLTDIHSIALISSLLPDWRGLLTRKRFVMVLLISTGIFIHIILSSVPPLSLYKWIRVLHYSLLTLFVYKNAYDVRKQLARVFPFTLVWTSLLALGQWINAGSLNGLFYWLGERSFTVDTPGIALSKVLSSVSLRPYATLPHPNALAGFLFIGWMLALHHRKKDRAWYAITALVFFVIIVCESTAVFVALAFAAFGSFVTHHTLVSPYYSRALLIGAFVASLLTPVFFLSLPPQVISNMSKNSRERVELSVIAGHVFGSNPIKGVGLGTFISSIPQEQTRLPAVLRMRATALFQPVHNIPLLLLTELGILGTIGVMLGLLTIPISQPLAAVFVIGLFDHYWVTLHQPLLLLSLVIGLSLAGRNKGKESSR